MRKVLLVVILVSGVVAASSLLRYSGGVVAAAPQSTAAFDSDGKLQLPVGLSTLGLSRCTVDAQWPQQWQGRLPRIPSRLCRGKKPRCVSEDRLLP